MSTTAVTVETRRPTAAAESRLLWIRGRDPKVGAPPDLGRLGWTVIHVKDAGEALRELGHAGVDGCVVDMTDNRAALTAVRLIRARRPGLTVVGLVDVTNVGGVGEALQAGVVDLLPWPASAEDTARLLKSLREPTPTTRRPTGATQVSTVALSSSMRAVTSRLTELAGTRRPVCLVGEEGAGRHRLARMLHQLGVPADAPMVVVDPAGRTPVELETELFGVPAPHDSSQLDRLAPASVLARAHGGTVFLRHLGDVASRVQVRLTRLLRDGEADIAGVCRVVDVRLIASLDAPLDDAVAEGRVRRDLAERFTPIVVPPLRERALDVPLLADDLLREAVRLAGREVLTLSRPAAALLAALPWPENVRELKTLMTSLADVAGPTVTLEDVLSRVHLGGERDRVDVRLPLREARAQFERQFIAAAVVRHRGRMAEAARALGIQRTNLYRKMRQLRLKRPVPSGRA